MKRGALLLISLFLLLSCSRKEDTTPPEKWQLLARGPLEVVDDWVFDGIPRQYYYFYKDQTFLKIRKGEEILEVKGTYNVEEEGKRYILIYEEPHSLIENCSEDNTESLYFMKIDEELVMANVSCSSEDGSASIYLKVKED